MEKIFNVFYSKKYDKRKPDIAFFDIDKRVKMDNIYVSRFMFNTLKILSKDFNVFVFNLGNNKKAAQPIIDMYNELNYVFMDDKYINIFKKADSENCVQMNIDNIKNIVKKELNIFNDLRAVFIRPTVLYVTTGNNEDFDCIKTGEQLEKANDLMKQLNDDIENKKMYAYTMFMTRQIRIMHDVIENIINMHNPKVYQFIYDPAHYCNYFNKKYNAKTYYFENDFRGNREFNQFPIGQLNYLYNYEKPETIKFGNKENNFIWGGIVLYAKGDRINNWFTFLKDFYYKNSVLHVSNNNSINKKGGNQSKSLLNHPRYKETIDTIKNHPLNQGILPNNEFEQKLKNYKYTFIQKCVSINDSLNFRIYYSLLYDIIPFIDENYDIDNLQIPKEFKDILSVSNHNDIINKIDYFEKNPKEAEKTLNDMKKYFLNEKYSQEEYYYNEFKNNYFKEIYK